MARTAGRSCWFAPARGRSRPRPPGRSRDPPEHADDATEHGGVAGAKRLHAIVLGLQADVVLLAEEPLHRRLVLEQGDDDLTVARLLGGPDDDEVALDDAGVLHAVAADPEDVVA